MVDLEPMADKWRAFGFKTVEVNGHDVEALNAVFMKQRREADGPYAVIAHTVKGKGLIESIAGTGEAHYLSGSYEAIQRDFTN